MFHCALDPRVKAAYSKSRGLKSTHRPNMDSGSFSGPGRQPPSSHTGRHATGSSGISGGPTDRLPVDLAGSAATLPSQAHTAKSLEALGDSLNGSRDVRRHPTDMEAVSGGGRRREPAEGWAAGHGWAWPGPGHGGGLCSDCCRSWRRWR